jgi:hypothetical protein
MVDPLVQTVGQTAGGPGRPECQQLALLLHDQLRRWATGSLLSLKPYRQADSTREASDERLLELATHEVLLRQERGEQPDVQEYDVYLPGLGARLAARLSQLSLLAEQTVAFEAASQPASPAPAAERAVTVPGFQILAELGRGAMGVVFKANQVGLKRVVALKMLLPGAQGDPADRARLLAEAEAVARLRHPNIVPVHQVGEHAGQVWFAMEYQAGGSLADRAAGTPRPPREAAAVVETLARAVHHAHLAGVVHRDLKPANVLLGEDGTLRLSDFGLAKRLDQQASLTPTGAIVGTPSYMAPEQARGEDVVGPPTDVYALGAILYELLTGQPPFLAETPLDTVLLVLSEEPQPPRRWQRGVPLDLEVICLKCLSKGPEKRYASAADLADDLRRFLDGDLIAARPPREGELAWQWLRKRRRSVEVFGGVLGMLALFVVISLTPSFIGVNANNTFVYVGTTVGPASPPAKPRASVEPAPTAVTFTLLVGFLGALALIVRPSLRVLGTVAGVALVAVIVEWQSHGAGAFAGLIALLVLGTGVVVGVLLGLPCRLLAWWLSSDVADTLLSAILGIVVSPFVLVCVDMAALSRFLERGRLVDAIPWPWVAFGVGGAFLGAMLGGLFGALRSPARREWIRAAKLRRVSG